MSDNKEQIQIHERLTRSETKIDTIMDNHLPHIQAKVDKVDKRVWIVLVSILTIPVCFAKMPPIIE